MKSIVISALMGLAVAGTMATPTAVSAQQHDRYDRDDSRRHRDRDDNRRHRDRDDYQWQGDRNGNWDPSRHYREGRRGERRLGRDDRIYRGGDGRYYCRRNDGTTGLVIGGIAGGILGNAIGGDTLGTLLGAGGGALLGRSIDRGKVRCR
jgi:Ni/Co efflux regulator RcnB